MAIKARSISSDKVLRSGDPRRARALFPGLAVRELEEGCSLACLAGAAGSHIYQDSEKGRLSYKIRRTKKSKERRERHPGPGANPEALGAAFSLFLRAIPGSFPAMKANKFPFALKLV